MDTQIKTIISNRETKEKKTETEIDKRLRFWKTANERTKKNSENFFSCIIWLNESKKDISSFSGF